MVLFQVGPDELPLIARACHEANRAYCVAIGDGSQVAWDEAPAWQKDSACKGVLGVLCNGDTPRQSHESWVAEKIRTGWKYGLRKDPQKLEHPCIVPYEQLPPQQQHKDELFGAVCVAMARALELPQWRPTRASADSGQSG